MKKISIHAGHAADGNSYCGAIGFVKESTVAREIKDAVISYLNEFDVTDITIDKDNVSATNLLLRLVNTANKGNYEVNISIHLNAFKKAFRDNQNKGVEVWLYNTTSELIPIANNICKNISELGFNSRGVRFNKNYIFLNRTLAPSMIIECFFCDDEDDVEIYKKVGAAEIGKAIAYAINNYNYKFDNIEKKKGDTVMVELNILREGSAVPEVKTVQIMLNAKGFRDSNNNVLNVDGKWGPKTSHVFNAFQKANDLEPDGVCGPLSWNKLLK